MPIYPGATQRLLTGYKKARTEKVRTIVLHSTAGGAASPYPTFAKGGACSTGWVGYEGQIEQYLDGDWMDAADLYSGGGPYALSLETASNVQATDPWTDAQLDAIVSFIDWACREYGIPRRRAQYAGDAGIAWHRMGVVGSFPAGDLGGLTQIGRGDTWSTSRGKACPGDKRIRQAIDVVIPRVVALGVSGGGGMSVPTTSTGGSSSTTSSTTPVGDLVVDGRWGSGTTRALQRVLGTTVDGVVSSQDSTWRAQNPGLTTGWEWLGNRGAKGSRVIAAAQRKLGVTDDGLIGPKTIKALQKRLGTRVDGVLDDKSPCIKALQRRLNDGRF